MQALLGLLDLLDLFGLLDLLDLFGLLDLHGLRDLLSFLADSPWLGLKVSGLLFLPSLLVALLVLLGLVAWFTLLA